MSAQASVKHKAEGQLSLLTELFKPVLLLLLLNSQVKSWKATELAAEELKEGEILLELLK